jgi:glycosyltransferase involved in cell wall biosynthesis
LGGSPLNAIELAAAVRDRGHEVAVYARDGALVDYIRELRLEYIPAKPSRIHRETTGRRAVAVLATAWHLHRVARSRGVDVLHGYEWPPIVEAYAAAQRTPNIAVVGSVMAMQVPPFIPSTVPLIVGTKQLCQQLRHTRPGPVHLLEPPVDLASNFPGASSSPFSQLPPTEPGTIEVVVVSRLSHQLKLEGILTAVRSIGEVARTRPVRLVIVGGGEAFDTVAAEAALVNTTLGKQAVVLTGELADPRPAYDAADVCLGMGGSALRAMAFGKPLIVQGESGFFETLTPTSAESFLEGGWYGVSNLDSHAATNRLTGLLTELLSSPARRAELGAFGRHLVQDRFSLTRAAESLEGIYRDAIVPKPTAGGRLRETAVAGMVMTDYTVRRILNRA